MRYHEHEEAEDDEQVGSEQVVGAKEVQVILRVHLVQVQVQVVVQEKVQVHHLTPDTESQQHPAEQGEGGGEQHHQVPKGGGRGQVVVDRCRWTGGGRQVEEDRWRLE